MYSYSPYHSGIPSELEQYRGWLRSQLYYEVFGVVYYMILLDQIFFLKNCNLQSRFDLVISLRTAW